MADDERMRHTHSPSEFAADRQERESPRGHERRRSRSLSPRRDRDGKDTHDDRPRRRKDAGFKWKEKRRDEYRRRDERDSGGLQRGYKDFYRPRSRSPRREDRGEQVLKTDRDENKITPNSQKQGDGREKEKKKIATPAVAGAHMITVYVNDRLGTKKAVPCLASDSVGDFKKIVASMIGRPPHEILLKRQSERPFKDFLTLQDYGISNGVQIDLEVDTGD